MAAQPRECRHRPCALIAPDEKSRSLRRQLPRGVNPDRHHGPWFGSDIGRVVTPGFDVVRQETVAGAQNQMFAGASPDFGLPSQEYQKASCRRRMEILGGGGFEQLDHPRTGRRYVDEAAKPGDAFGMNIEHGKVDGRQMSFPGFVSVHSVEGHVADYMRRDRRQSGDDVQSGGIRRGECGICRSR